MSAVFSIVLPIFNEELVIPELHRRLTRVMERIQEPYELIFVNDCSSDRSLEQLRALAQQDTRVRVLHFSRNFGHQIAITAGMDHSQGQAVILMDADLQDPPEVLPDLISQWREGYDVVYAVRTQRAGEGLLKRGTAALFYRLLQRISGIDIPPDTGDFRLLSRRAVNALGTLRERHRFLRGRSRWIGSRQVAVPWRE